MIVSICFGFYGADYQTELFSFIVTFGLSLPLSPHTSSTAHADRRMADASGRRSERFNA
jgi:hypothetical protein